MKSKIISIMTIIIIVASAIILTPQITSNEKTIKIGSILILTGEGASWGIAEKNGIDMAIERINSEDGINGKIIEVIHENDKSDPKESISAFRKLVDQDSVKFIIGTTWSHTGLPLVNMSDKNKIIMISPSLGMKEFNEGSDYLFNTWPHDYILSERLAEIVYNKGHRNVAVIGAQQVWVKDQTNAFTKKFKSLGGTIGLIFEPNTADRNLNTEALRIKENKNVDALVFLTDGVQVGTIMAQKIKEIGIDLPSYSVTLSQDDITSSKSAYDSTIFLTSLTPSSEFENEYKEKYGMDIEIGADSAYDAVMMLAQAMKETNSTDTTTIANYMNSIKEYHGVSGSLISDGKGGFTKEYVAKLIVNGIPTAVEI